jgi:hypothetical protein
MLLVNRNSEERFNQIEDDALSGNSDVKNNEDTVLLQTTCKTPIGTAVYPGSELLNGKVSEEPKNLDFPSYPRRNCPAKKDPNYLWP